MIPSFYKMQIRLIESFIYFIYCVFT